MGGWLASTWTAVWPNLLADAAWVPLVWLVHRTEAAAQRVEREMHTAYLDRIHTDHQRQVTTLHEDHQQHLRVLLNEHHQPAAERGA